MDTSTLDNWCNDGELLSQDMDMVSVIAGHSNPAKTLAVESVSRRWGFRKVATEAFSFDDMVEAFLEWLEEVSLMIGDMIKSCVGQGARALRAQQRYDDKIDALIAKGVTPATSMVSKSEYAKHFYIHDAYDIGACNDIAKTIPSDMDFITTWAIDVIKEAANVFEMVKGSSGRFDTVNNANFNKIAGSTILNFDSFIGKRIDGKLPLFATGQDMEDNQLLWGLPGNAYMQYHRLYVDGKKIGKVLPIEGIRYISPEFKGVALRDMKGEESLMSLESLRKAIRDLKPIASALYDLETSNSYIQREIKQLRRIVANRKKNRGEMSDAERYSYRLAKERLISANNTLRVATFTLRTLVEGNLKRIESHWNVYADAK